MKRLSRQCVRCCLKTRRGAARPLFFFAGGERMTCSKAVEIIKNYKKRYLFPPRANWSDYQFRLRSYGRYFADKLVDMLCEAPIGTDPIFIVERLEDSIDDWMAKCDWQVQYRFGAISLEAIKGYSRAAFVARRQKGGSKTKWEHLEDFSNRQGYFWTSTVRKFLPA